MEKVRKFSYTEPKKEGGHRKVVFVEGGYLYDNKVKIDSIIKDTQSNGVIKITVRVRKDAEITVWKELIINTEGVCVFEYDWKVVL